MTKIETHLTSRCFACQTAVADLNRLYDVYRCQCGKWSFLTWAPAYDVWTLMRITPYEYPNNVRDHLMYRLKRTGKFHIPPLPYWGFDKLKPGYWQRSSGSWLWRVYWDYNYRFAGGKRVYKVRGEIGSTVKGRDLLKMTDEELLKWIET